MNELLETQGWKLYYTCKVCGGNKKYFKNESFPGYEVRVRFRKNGNIFSIMHMNKTIAGTDWMHKIEQKLKENALFKTV